MGTSPLTQDTLTFPMYQEAWDSLLGEGRKAYPGRPLGPERGERFHRDKKKCQTMSGRVGSLELIFWLLTRGCRAEEVLAMPVGATEAGSVGGGGRAEREEQQKEKQKGKEEEEKEEGQEEEQQEEVEEQNGGQKRAAPLGALSFRGLPVLWLHAWSCCQWLLYPMGAKGDSGAVTMQSQKQASRTHQVL